VKAQQRTDKADYCRALLDCPMFGRCRKQSHGSVAAAATVACGNAGWHRDVSVEEGGIDGGVEGATTRQIMDKQTRKNT
jgi:hypothetical protein